MDMNRNGAFTQPHGSSSNQYENRASDEWRILHELFMRISVAASPERQPGLAAMRDVRKNTHYRRGLVSQRHLSLAL